MVSQSGVCSVCCSCVWNHLNSKCSPILNAIGRKCFCLLFSCIAVRYTGRVETWLEREKEKQTDGTDGDGRREDGRWECFYYRFMWRDDWRGSRGTHRRRQFLYIYFFLLLLLLHSFLSSLGRGQGVPSPGARRLKKKMGRDEFFGLYPHSASSYAFRFDSYSLIYFFSCVFFFS